MKPKVIGLLIQQGCHRQLQRITPLNVQRLCKCRLANAAWEGQAVDLLVVSGLYPLANED